ncbi:bifunctional molybdenum cofactor biosynthesis protein MoaC/MoaB [Gracilimonas mengyeensis]|uniref:Molybdenum cofactor biosynthesis protein MoaC n=1 Tax=Gracilimonas mengyeensis TaxID=1302730 RepID=A0A521BM07_9BACT|nr:bifunctional molybdenum cofactor biosynthesis protein MoaC/MoaB [Gracilimonas mengyeensis]SMO48125.1 molybdenum cofactor biosynthesis protein MoaC [Gracilimonas mengyeensis]
MIDIHHKNTTLRYARASGKIFLDEQTLERVKQKTVPKGDVASVARSAGILTAKRTPDWMVFSHTLPLDWVDISMEILPDALKFTAEARTVWKTGLEMEVMVAVNGALLNAYDMLKPLQEDITLGDIRLEEKNGGKSDHRDHFDRPITAALLTVSTAKKDGNRPNHSAEIIREFLEDKSITLSEEELLAEQKEDIEATLDRLSGSVDLILLTGSSGAQKSDLVPDIVRQKVDKLLPGIGEAMRQYGFQRTPFAMLSNQVAGLKGDSLIISLPGSSSGAEESLHALFPGVLHLFKMIGR